MHCESLPGWHTFRVCTLHILLGEVKDSLGVIIPDYLMNCKIAQTIKNKFFTSQTLH